MNRIHRLKCFGWLIGVLVPCIMDAQQAELNGVVRAGGSPVEFATVMTKDGRYGAITDTLGFFRIHDLQAGNYRMTVTAIGYNPVVKDFQLKAGERKTWNVDLTPHSMQSAEVVVSGTLREVSRLDSPVPVEVYSSKFFKSNPTPTLFDALQTINGVRPQLNCNICNTGDIHINGLEGPNTMVLIDGMPIVSGLSTVYGLSGIPQSLIDRVEIVKGPASTLYGSEAVGGLINVITRKPQAVPLFSTDVFATHWGEVNADIASKLAVGKRTQSYLGVNYYNYQSPRDDNGDGFTDVTLQQRISLFNKWNFDRKNGALFTLAGRYIYEDRWGGDMRWQPKYRGGDSLYAESIYTNRWELFGIYQLPTRERITVQFSMNGHYQNSAYGATWFLAKQVIGFGQALWTKSFHRNELLTGITFRQTLYDDNTPATEQWDDQGMYHNNPSSMVLPGIFLQDEIDIGYRQKLLLGVRYDYNSIHGSIVTPRFNYKWSSNNRSAVCRLSVGNGYRVVNIFTEDHAALTGARKVEIASALKPEKSWNANINVIKRWNLEDATSYGVDITTFYTYFNNKIIADYQTDPNKIIYNNLDGYAISKGISANVDALFNNGWKLRLGGTWMDVYSMEDGVRLRQMFTERFTGTWSVAYTFLLWNLTLDYTGNVYSPMRLPLLSASDPRREYSPWWSIQNIQVTLPLKHGFEVYGGVKNLLNWTPNEGNPFIIARANDPFDKQVQFDEHGQAMITPNNPYGLTFDPTYVYAPNQGRRSFIGIRYAFK